VLAQGPHVVPVPGTKQERWVTENTAATEVRLTPDDLREIAALPPAQGSWD
jgi:aryl-alcohol dehydrogenase-like predicted oxidoreductase